MYEAVIILVFTACNNELINERDVELSGSYVTELFSRHCPEGAEEIHGNL
jgi:hypothetical protein